MKNLLKTLILLTLTLCASSVFAFTIPSAPPNGTYVLDLSGKLSTQQVQSLNEKIENIKSNTNNEFGVLLLQNMDGENVEDVAYKVFNTWGIGKKGLDNGVLIVIAVAERKTRIETGKGVGELTDLQSSDILANILRPSLKKGDFFGGLNATIDAASGAIESRKKSKAVVNSPTPAPTNNLISNSPSENSSDDGGSLILFLVIGGLVVGGFVIYNIISNKREKKRLRLEKLEYDRQYKEALRNIERTRAAAIERQKTIVSTVQTAKIPTTTSSIKTSSVKKKESFPTKTAVVGAVALGAAAVAAEEIARHQREEAERARKRREREEEEERAASRRRDEESSRSSSSSSWPSSSDSGSSWGGGGFDGGSSGGGGSSGDW